MSRISGGMQIITNKRKNLFYKVIHLSMQFSALVNRFIVKA